MADTLLILKTNAADNVAIAVMPIDEGVQVCPGVTTLCAVPMGHKIALRAIGQGEAVIRYGTVISYAKEALPAGAWVNEHNTVMPKSPALSDMEYATNLNEELPRPTRTTFMGYDNGPDSFAGTRNYLGIMSCVQCVSGVLDVAVERIRRELLPKYPHVDGVVPVHHTYGCGVAIDAPEADIPIRSLKNMLHHPNFGGQIMAVSLGCEKLSPQRLLSPQELAGDNLVVLQDHKGFGAMVEAICAMAERKLKILEKRRRVELPLNKLCIGMQCGGSDAFSGLTANPSAGYASDMLVSGGATVMFSEVTEVRDGVAILAKRTIDKPTCDALAREMKWYDDYLALGGVDRSANTTPGNKKGGLSNIVEKAMGSIAKSGGAPIVQVIAPGMTPTARGLIYAATPASDIVCGPCQAASGATLQVFMTGRGTPYGLAALPVIKVSSNTALKEKWDDLIDIDAGVIATGQASIEQVGQKLFDFILATASGEAKPFAEKWGLVNYMAIFNPAPIT